MDSLNFHEAYLFYISCNAPLTIPLIQLVQAVRYDPL